MPKRPRHLARLRPDNLRRLDAIIPDRKLELLRAVPSFKDVSASTLRELARLLDIVTVEPGEVLEREGDHVDEFFVIVDGTARVRRDGTDLRLLDGGDVVGDAGLLRHEPSQADVVALTPLTVLVGTPRDFASVRRLLPGWAAVVDTTVDDADDDTDQGDEAEHSAA